MATSSPPDPTKVKRKKPAAKRGPSTSDVDRQKKTVKRSASTVSTNEVRRKTTSAAKKTGSLQNTPKPSVKSSISSSKMRVTTESFEVGMFTSAVTPTSAVVSDAVNQVAKATLDSDSTSNNGSSTTESPTATQATKVTTIHVTKQRKATTPTSKSVPMNKRITDAKQSINKIIRKKVNVNESQEPAVPLGTIYSTLLAHFSHTHFFISTQKT